MKKQIGFTLIEVMIVIIIVGIVASIAAPSLSSLIKNNRLKSQAFDMLGSINIARGEAVKRKTQTIMCRSANPTAASPTCGGTSPEWTTGWIVYANGDTNDDYNSATDTLIDIGDAAGTGVEIMASSAGDIHLVFNTDGTLDETAQVLYSICDERGTTNGRQIGIALVGRASLIYPATDCTP